MSGILNTVSKDAQYIGRVGYGTKLQTYDAYIVQNEIHLASASLSPPVITNAQKAESVRLGVQHLLNALGPDNSSMSKGPDQIVINQENLIEITDEQQSTWSLNISLSVKAENALGTSYSALKNQENVKTPEYIKELGLKTADLRISHIWTDLSSKIQDFQNPSESSAQPSAAIKAKDITADTAKAPQVSNSQAKPQNSDFFAGSLIHNLPNSNESSAVARQLSQNMAKALVPSQNISANRVDTIKTVAAKKAIPQRNLLLRLLDDNPDLKAFWEIALFEKGKFVENNIEFWKNLGIGAGRNIYQYFVASGKLFDSLLDPISKWPIAAYIIPGFALAIMGMLVSLFVILPVQAAKLGVRIAATLTWAIAMYTLLLISGIFGALIFKFGVEFLHEYVYLQLIKGKKAKTEPSSIQAIKPKTAHETNAGTIADMPPTTATIRQIDLAARVARCPQLQSQLINCWEQTFANDAPALNENDDARSTRRQTIWTQIQKSDWRMDIIAQRFLNGAPAATHVSAPSLTQHTIAVLPSISEAEAQAARWLVAIQQAIEQPALFKFEGPASPEEALQVFYSHVKANFCYYNYFCDVICEREDVQALLLKDCQNGPFSHAGDFATLRTLIRLDERTKILEVANQHGKETSATCNSPLCDTCLQKAFIKPSIGKQSASAKKAAMNLIQQRQAAASEHLRTSQEYHEALSMVEGYFNTMKEESRLQKGKITPLTQVQLPRPSSISVIDTDEIEEIVLPSTPATQRRSASSQSQDQIRLLPDPSEEPLNPVISYDETPVIEMDPSETVDDRPFILQNGNISLTPDQVGPFLLDSFYRSILETTTNAKLLWHRLMTDSFTQLYSKEIKEQFVKDWLEIHGDTDSIAYMELAYSPTVTTDKKIQLLARAKTSDSEFAAAYN